jgi:hypothetical protein
LREVILKQPGFGEGRAQGDFVFPRQRTGAQHRRQELDCIGSAPAFERSMGPAKYSVNRDGCHREEYTKYAARQLCNS